MTTNDRVLTLIAGIMLTVISAFVGYSIAVLHGVTENSTVLVQKVDFESNGLFCQDIYSKTGGDAPLQKAGPTTCYKTAGERPGLDDPINYPEN